MQFIDIESKSSSKADKPSWTHSGNSFRFNFLPDNPPAPLKETFSFSDKTESTKNQISFTGQCSAFSFNFQIPPITPVELMDTTDTPDTSATGSQQDIQNEKSSPRQPNSLLEPVEHSKEKKKKKKSGKKKPSGDIEPQQTPNSTEGSQGDKDTEPSAEEQLNRQLDWCIEQLELGTRSQKSTPKQKEEASRALKTLRSSKAPLVKKRQVMRAMTGDYRKKIEEEKIKQHKLIQSEISSAQVKVVSDSSKKCVYHRRAGTKTETSAAEENLQKHEAKCIDLTTQDQEGTPTFVFAPSKEKFTFNFF